MPIQELKCDREAALPEAVQITPWQDRGLWVNCGSARHQGLVIHGYGCCSLEMLGLAVSLASGESMRLLLFDLPGHGSAFNEEFTAKAALAATKEAVAAIRKPAFVIGHSLGGRLSLATGISNAVLLSMPGTAEFEGSRSSLLRVLRPQRVNEAVRFQALKELLAGDVRPAPHTLFLTAGRDLKSVRDMAAAWQTEQVSFAKIKNCDHGDIMSSRETEKVIKAWLKQNLH